MLYGKARAACLTLPKASLIASAVDVAVQDTATYSWVFVGSVLFGHLPNKGLLLEVSQKREMLLVCFRGSRAYIL